MDKQTTTYHTNSLSNTIYKQKKTILTCLTLLNITDLDVSNLFTSGTVPMCYLYALYVLYIAVFVVCIMCVICAVYVIRVFMFVMCVICSYV